MDDLVPLLRLHFTAGIGMVTYRKLLRRFGSTEAVLAAPEDRLAEIDGLGPQTARKIVESRAESAQKAEQEIARAESAGVRILPYTSPHYPVSLRTIYDPPIVLYVKGSVEVRDTAAVAIVGARKCSGYGRGQAQRLAEGLADAGFTIISGLALGIDAAAHRGALRSPTGRTLAVMGNGLDQMYPAENQELADEIAERGALVTEFPLRTSPARENFPKRNRVISGLSLGVIVVEGRKTAGSLITARFAGDQGKEVFAVPGRVGDALAEGPHTLIRQSATLVESIDDVLTEIGPMADDFIASAQQEAEAQRASPRGGVPQQASKTGAGTGAAARAQTLSGRERAVYERLGDDPILIDDLIHESGLSPQEVSGTLMVLEIKRLCKQLPGKRFVRAD